MEQTGSIVVNGTPIIVERIYPFRIAIINDLHVGSQFALVPEGGWTDHYGTTIIPNEGQVKLSEYLDQFAEVCREQQVTMLWIPGDVTAGQNPREAGKFIYNIELDEQKRMAAQVIAELVEMVPSIERIWIWKGTGYHGSRDTGIELGVATVLRADHGMNGMDGRPLAEYKGEYSLIKLVYEEYVKNILITHHASNAYMYPEQAMGKDMLLYQEAMAQGKLPPVDMIIRAHKHSFIEVHKPSIRSLQLPCWQFFVPYDNAMKNYGRWQPDIGGVIMLFDHKLRSTVWHFTYPNFIDPLRFVRVELAHGVKRKSLLKRLVGR